MARTEKVVADASVVVKWYNLEAETEEALELRRDYAARRIELTAPYLLSYEVANALRYNPDFGAEDVRSAVKDLTDMQMTLKLLDEQQVHTAIEVAFKYGITFYDATYFALAKEEDIKFYTADDRLIAKVPDQAIRHIREYGRT
jgi:predicted nucleic acid-binding protein